MEYRSQLHFKSIQNDLFFNKSKEHRMKKEETYIETGNVGTVQSDKGKISAKNYLFFGTS